MTPRLPTVDAKEIIKVLEKLGFQKVRQSGSHVVMKNPAGQRTVIPDHGKSALKRKTLKAILSDADLTIDELLKLL